MDIQKQGIIDQVIESQKSGRKVNEVLSVMGIKSSTFYRWKKQLNNKDEKRVIHPSDRITTRSLTDEEVVLILKTKDENPQMRHRQIQGLLQNKSHYLCSFILKYLLETLNNNFKSH